MPNHEFTANNKSAFYEKFWLQEHCNFVKSEQERFE